MNCPIEPDLDEQAAQWTCEQCFLNSDEYAELSDHSELFYLALEHIQFHELGLDRGGDAYTYRERHAIALVHAELNHLQTEKAKEGREARRESAEEFRKRIERDRERGGHRRASPRRRR